jgi:hypothetical protein
VDAQTEPRGDHGRVLDGGDKAVREDGVRPGLLRGRRVTVGDSLEVERFVDVFE